MNNIIYHGARGGGKTEQQAKAIAHYTPAVLATICPVCHAVGMCLRPKRDGSDYMPEPHPERVTMADTNQVFCDVCGLWFDKEDRCTLH